MHALTLKGKESINWVAKYAEHIDVWNRRMEHVVATAPQDGLLGANSVYMQWYMRSTRRWMTKEAAHEGLSVNFVNLFD